MNVVTLEEIQRFFLDPVYPNVVFFLETPALYLSQREFGTVYVFQNSQHLENGKGSDLNLGQNFAHGIESPDNGEIPKNWELAKEIRTGGRSVSSDIDQGINDIKERGLKKRRRKTTCVKVSNDKMKLALREDTVINQVCLYSGPYWQILQKKYL